MKLTIALMLAAILGWQFTTAVDSAARSLAKPEKAACKVGRALL